MVKIYNRVNFPNYTMPDEFHNHLVKHRLQKLYSDYDFNHKLTFIDLLELYRITEYIINFEGYFEVDQYDKRKIKGNNYKIINKLASNFSSKNIEKEFNDNQYSYRLFNNILWDFVSFQYLGKDDNKIKELIIAYAEKNCLFFPLKNKKIVFHFSDLLNKLLIKNPCNAEFYLNGDDNIYEPKGFSKEGYKNKLFSEYLKSEHFNINFVYQMITMKNISIDLKNKANEIYQNQNNELLKNNGIEYRTEVYIDEYPTFNKNIKLILKNRCLKIIINGEILLKHLDYKSIMDNFIYALGIFNGHFLLNSLNKSNNESLMQKLISDPNKNNYDYYFQANDYDMNCYSVFIAYFSFLRKHNINLEHVLEWFYKEYLCDEYDANYFDDIDIGVGLTSYFYKCNIIVSQLHKVMRTYNEYSKHFDNFNFDRSQIDISSKTPAVFSTLSSMNEKPKYVYITDDNLIKDIDILFSPNYEIYRKENLFVKYYKNADKHYIDDLIKYDILYVNNDDIIMINSNKKMDLFRYFFDNGVIPYYWLGNSKYKKIVDDMIINKHAKIEHTLMTKKESKYFDYFLNSAFGDGKELRNKYAHGATNSLSKTEHEQNYFRLLYLFFLLSIKINEEFDYNANSLKYNNEFNIFKMLSM